MLKTLITVASLLAASAYAQTVTGSWQGTLPPKPPATDGQRIVLRINKADDGTLRGSIYRLGTGGPGIPMTTTTFTPPNLIAEQHYANVSFTGKLSVDGKSFEGTFTYGANTWPLTLTLATGDDIWKLDYAGAAAMAANADPSFEVATIKPAAPDAQMKRFGTRTRSFKAVNQSVTELICWAYHLRNRQIEGAPAWMETEHFDIAGEPDLPGQPSLEQYRLMLRKLLAERFNFKMHMTQKTVPVYALTVEKTPLPITASDPSVNPGATVYVKQAPDGQLLAGFNDSSMSDFADILMNFIADRQIIDETGIKGHYDFGVKLPAEILGGKTTTEDDTTNAFLNAVHQIGMKLVPKKAPIDIMVIDHIDQPSAN